MLADTREKGREAVRELIDRVAGMLGGTLLVITLITVMVVGGDAFCTGLSARSRKARANR